MIKMACPICGGTLEDGSNEHGFHCDTCDYPYPENNEIKHENGNKPQE